MELLDKELATSLFLKGNMPEWFYRQNYKSVNENYTETHQKIIELFLNKVNQTSILEKYINNQVQEITIDLFK